MKKSACLTLRSLGLVAVLGSFSLAQAAGELSQTFTLDGQLRVAGSAAGLADAQAKLLIQILDPTKKCVLYEEEQSVNTLTTKGYFNIQVGSQLGASKRTASDPGRTMVQVFQNSAAISAGNAQGQTCPGGVYSPAAHDSRYFRLVVTPSATNVAETLSPDTLMDAVPLASVAQTLQGLDPSSFVQVGAGDLTQSNLQNIFASGNATKLSSLLSVNPSDYLRKNAANNTFTLPAATSPAAPSAGALWYESGSLKYYDGSTTQTLETTGGGSASVAKAGDTMTGTLNLPSNGLVVGTSQLVVASGKVGIGTTSPAGQLDVVGQSRNVSSTGGAQINAVATIDWNNGNAQSLSVDCTSTSFTNMLDGGTYVLAVTETGASTCIFSQAGLSFYFQPGNGPRTSGKRSVYTFQRIGTDVYVSWIKGFQ